MCALPDEAKAETETKYGVDMENFKEEIQALKSLKDAKEEDRIESQTVYYDDGSFFADSCYCDNGHEQNDTVCRYCWHFGRRDWNDPELEDNPNS